MLRTSLLALILSLSAFGLASPVLAGACAGCTAAAKCACEACKDCDKCKEGKCAECPKECCKPKADRPTE
jgi:hypothetical protein